MLFFQLKESHFPLFLFVSLQLFLVQNLHRTLEGWVGGLETAPLRAIPLALWKRMENEEGEAGPEKAALPQEAGMSHAQSSRRVFAGSCCWDKGSCCTCSASDVNPSFSLNFSSEHCRAPSRGAPGGHVQSHQGVASQSQGCSGLSLLFVLHLSPSSDNTRFRGLALQESQKQKCFKK